MTLFSSYFFCDRDSRLFSNYLATVALNELLVVLAGSLSHTDLYTAVMSSHAANPNSCSWEKSYILLPLRFLCLINHTMYCSEHMMFFASPTRSFSVLNREKETKLLSHRCGSAVPLA